MVHSGGIQYYGEDASEKFAALMKDDPMVRTRSITVEVLDDKKMLELEVEGNFYRAEKLKLYCDQNNLELGEGKILGSMRVYREMDTEIPAEVTGELLKCNCKGVQACAICERPNNADSSLFSHYLCCRRFLLHFHKF